MLAFFKGLAVVAGLAGAGYLAVGHMDSTGGVSVAGPVCLTRAAQPGTVVTVTANVANASGAPAKIDLSTDPVVGQPVGPPYPAGGHPLPKSWAGVSGPYSLAPGTTVRAPVTIHIPPTAHGRYGTMIYAHSYGHPGASGDQVAFGGGAGAYLEMSVDAPPPPRQFCDGQWQWFTPYDPPFPVCKHKQSPGRLGMCRVLPLHPPVANARNCHMTRSAWHRYEHLLSLTGSQYAAHCEVDGRLLNTLAYYRRTGMYRYADTGQAGSVTDARPANNPDIWRTSGTR